MPATITQTSKLLHPRALDTSGNNNHGTSYTGQALEFDGVTDHFALPAIELNATGDFTFAVWVNLDDVSNGGKLISGPGGFEVNIDAVADKLRIYSSISASSQQDMTHGMSDATWHRLVYTQSGNSAKLYNNGALVSSATQASQVDSDTNYAGYFSKRHSGNASGYVACKACDLQMWDIEWSASDVTYDYLNPEKLVLDNSSTSSAYSNLLAWYPMQDSTRGSQINLIDGAGTGLGTTPLTNSNFDTGDFTGWAAGGSITSEVVSHDGHSTAAHITTSSTDNGYNQNVLTIGQVYKISFDVKVISGSMYLGKNNNRVGRTDPSDSNSISYTDSSWTSYTHYWTAGDTYFRVYSEDDSSEFYVDNISVLPINAKNHGTSTFYGDELISNGGFETNVSGWTDYNGSLASGPTHNTSHAKVGAESLSFLCNAIYEAVKTTYTTVTGRTYTVSFWAKPLDGESQIRVTIIEGDGSGSILASNYALSGLSTATGTVGSGNWYNFTYTYVEASGGSSAEIRIGADGSDADTTFAIDEVTIKEVGFATGWTDADAQTTIPQLGFQSYNQLAWFDGTADYVSIGDQNYYSFGDESNDSPFSVSAWIFMDEATIFRIIGKCAYDGSNKMEWAFLVDSNDDLRLVLYDGTSGNYISQKSDNTLSAGQWYHVAATYDATEANSGITLYVDGSLIASTGTDIGSYTALHATDATVEIGRLRYSVSTVNYSEGCVTEASIWNKELSLAEVQELYNDGEALDALTHSSKTNLVGYWRNEGGTTWTDLSIDGDGASNGNHGDPQIVSEYLILPEGQNNRDTQGFLMNRNRVGLNLDGVAAYVEFDFDFSEHSNWTVSFWEYREKATGASIGADTHSFFVSESGSNIKLYTSGGSTWSINNNITIGTVAYGQWVHRAVVKNGYSYLGYENGALIIWVADSGQEAVLASAKIRSGRRAGSSDPFNGMVDDIAIYSSALDINQVARNYNAGKRRHQN